MLKSSLKKSGSQAIVNNYTFETKTNNNLDHYDISSALQTTLELNELIHIFTHKIKHLIPHNSFVYKNNEFDLILKNGIITKYSCTYALKFENMQLGSLKIMRRQKFDRAEIKLLESLLCLLIYPLKNATLYKQALKMAYTDPLTKTSNKAALNDSLQREMELALRNSRHLSVIFFDLDHFKKINDTYDHACGDMALASAAHCIKEVVRGSDLVFRYGGEEFVILLTDADLGNAKAVAEKIRISIENHTIAYGMDILKLTASLGVSTFTENDNSDSIIKRADNAMYRAKDNGRNQVQTELCVQ